jgi:hypothetical protein
MEIAQNLYLFLDESGNFDFTNKGTKYFVLTAIATTDPIIERISLVDLRYKLLSEGSDVEYFHASEDMQKTRDAVFEILSKIGTTFEIHSVLAQKNKAHPSLYRENYYKKGKFIERTTGIGLYKQVCETLLQYVFKGKSQKVAKIVIVLGSLFNGERKKVVLHTLKKFLKLKFPDVAFEIYCHQACSDLNCQLADYCCWAVSVKKERGEDRPYKSIEKMIKSEFDIFRNGTIEFY